MRHIMEPDKTTEPNMAATLWLLAAILGLVILLALMTQ